VNPEKIYVVVPGELGWRVYDINELVCLWRTAQLPPNATFQNDSGEWRQVAELVDPILERESRTTPRKTRNSTSTVGRRFQRLHQRWVRVGLITVIVIGVLGVYAIFLDRHRARGARPSADEEALTLQREGQMEAVIKSGEVIPGMTQEQVRRSWGEPKTKKETADSTKQQWIYRSQTVIFENGVVTHLEGHSR